MTNDQRVQVIVYVEVGRLRIRHGWIKVGNRIHNFSINGVESRDIQEVDLNRFQETYEMGSSTEMTEEEFEEWAQTSYSPWFILGFWWNNSYDLLWNNCNDFVRASCKKLGFQPPY